jgi:hypothetical protein
MACVMFACVVLCVSGVATATSIVARTVPELSALSSLVVEATVGEQRSWIETDGPIYTETSLTVHRYLKGQGPVQLSVTQRGGVVGDVRDAIPGDMTLQPGARVVIFLQEKDGRRWSTLLGWSVFEVLGDGPAAAVRRNADHLGLYRPSADGYRPVSSEQLSGPQTMADLVRALTEVTP